jgi:RNA polymerase sigma factor (sigma-70 family)
MAEREDCELVNAAAAGDAAAWDQLVQRYAGLIWAICRSCGLRTSDAADVGQVVWLRLVEHLNRLREPERLRSWLAVVTRNECLRVVRRAGREIVTDAAEDRHEAVNPSPEGRLVTTELHIAIREAFEELSPRCRSLLRVLAADPRPSYDEVSAILSMPVGSIGPTRQRCLECLRRQLERRQLGDDG